jgi:hypothetical protein
MSTAVAASSDVAASAELAESAAEARPPERATLSALASSAEFAGLVRWDSMTLYPMFAGRSTTYGHIRQLA